MRKKIMMFDYVYCGKCGYEDFDQHCAYSRNTANGEWYFCPCCGEDTISNDGADE